MQIMPLPPSNLRSLSPCRSIAGSGAISVASGYAFLKSPGGHGEIMVQSEYAKGTDPGRGGGQHLRR